jgi:DNA-binding transcriptional ArsR family regulator
MAPGEGAQLSNLFRLLGEPNRLRLVAACLDGPRSVGELTKEVGVSQSLVSQHLRLLRAGGC